MNQETHEPLETLSPECVTWCKSIGSSATTVKEAKTDQTVLKVISLSIRIVTFKTMKLTNIKI
jgi:hypothetical protein